MSDPTFKTAITYSPTEASKQLGIGRSTLFALLAKGAIKARKLGTRTLIPASELIDYVDRLPEAQFHSHLSKEV